MTAANVTPRTGITPIGWAYIALSTLTLLSFWMYRANINFYVYDNGGNQFEISLFETAYFLPSMFITYIGGVIADRSRALLRWLTLFATLNLVLLAGVAVMTYVSAFPFLGLLSATVALGVIGSLRNPPAAVFVRMISPKPVIAQMNALLSAGFNVARIAGPLVVGVLAVSFTTEDIFIVIPMICIPLVLFFIIIQGRVGSISNKTNAGNDDLGATPVSALGLARSYNLFLSAIVVFFLSSNLLWTTLPFEIEESFGKSQELFSYAYAVFGVGAILGSVAQPIVYRRYGVRWCFSSGALLYGIYFFVALTMDGWPVFCSIAAAGAGMGIFYSSINTHVLMSPNPANHGRLLALSIMLTNGFLAIGSVTLSSVATWGSDKLAYAVCIILLLIVTPAISLKIKQEI
ncbi:MFS transporter [Ruegeria sp. SCPT10]|uniref:MFS transporter n=1 Tax=Ruegeria sp. SCP10 TaxID=3141377 RepID=UPI003336A67C